MELLLIFLFGGRFLHRLQKPADEVIAFEQMFMLEQVVWFGAALGAIEFSSGSLATPQQVAGTLLAILLLGYGCMLIVLRQRGAKRFAPTEAQQYMLAGVGSIAIVLGMLAYSG